MGSEAEREFVITRAFDAPREAVFRAWTDGAAVARWFGPRGFTATCALDARPGGALRIVMRSPEGVEYPMKGVYREVAAPERLAYTSDLSENPADWLERLRKEAGGPAREEVLREFPTIVGFEEREGKTEVTVRSRFPSSAVRDAMLRMGLAEGWGETLDRLGEHLAKVEVSVRPARAPRAARRARGRRRAVRATSRRAPPAKRAARPRARP